MASLKGETELFYSELTRLKGETDLFYSELDSLKGETVSKWSV
jgi:hypothetical protein